MLTRLRTWLCRESKGDGDTGTVDCDTNTNTQQYWRQHTEDQNDDTEKPEMESMCQELTTWGHVEISGRVADMLPKTAHRSLSMPASKATRKHRICRRSFLVTHHDLLDEQPSCWNAPSSSSIEIRSLTAATSSLSLSVPQRSHREQSCDRPP